MIRRKKQMGRPKKISDEQLLSGTKQYFNEMCKGNIKMLKYPAIAVYLSGLYGIHVADYDLKKSKTVTEYVSSLKNAGSKQLIQKDVYFKRLDVENFLRTNTSAISLKKALTELDSHYENVSEAAGVIMNENRRLLELVARLQKENDILKSSNDDLEKRVVVAETEYFSIQKKCKEQETRIRSLVHIVEENVYPEIANELLVESGFLKNSTHIISEHGKAGIMDDTDSLLPIILNDNQHDFNSQHTSSSGTNNIVDKQIQHLIEDLSNI